MDEKGFIITPTNEVVLVKRGDKAVYSRSKNDEMMIHQYKRMPASILLNNPDKWSIGISDSGWQTQVTFFD